MRENREILIGERAIRPDRDTYIIAEMSANHNQDFGNAVRIIEAAKEAGADAVKLQTYTADTITLDSDAEPFHIHGTLWDGRNLHDLYQEAHTPWEWQPRLKTVADKLGIALFSSPFDTTSVEFLEEMGVPAYKIASPEIIDLPLITRVALTGKPIIMSTGMATLAEIDEAVRTIRTAGNTQIALLKCTSAYPAPPQEMNLRTIPHLAQAFDVPVGLSDHSMGVTVPVASVALGACIIEKHLTLSRKVSGPDSVFSLEPAEFKEMVEAVRVAERALGRVSYEVTPQEENTRVFRRSLFVVRDIARGERFTEENVRSIRPGHGLHPRHLTDVLGQSASVDLSRGTPLRWEYIGQGEHKG